MINRSQSQLTPSGGKQNRQRKQVTKSFIDEDGFMGKFGCTRCSGIGWSWQFNGYLVVGCTRAVSTLFYNSDIGACCSCLRKLSCVIVCARVSVSEKVWESESDDDIIPPTPPVTQPTKPVPSKAKDPLKESPAKVGCQVELNCHELVQYSANIHV